MSKIIKNGVFSESSYKNFLCMGKIGDLKKTDAYIRPGDIIAFMDTEEAGSAGRHTMMYIGPEKQIKNLKKSDMRIAHVTSGNFLEYNTGNCKIKGKVVDNEYKNNFKGNYNNGGAYNSMFTPYTSKHNIDDLYVIIIKNDAFMGSQESEVVKTTLSENNFNWNIHIEQ